MGSSANYRPPTWANASPAIIIITFPGQGQSPQYSNPSGGSVTLPPGQTNYVFDAVMTAAHEQDITKTEHPVQTGASISDHAYVRPARLTLDIGMSDAMDAYYNPSTWTGATSKSVSCYQTLLALQYSRIPLQITTRLRTYANMIIESLAPEESVKTIAGLRARVTFGQIFMADVVTVPVSARPQDTQETNQGSVNTQAPSVSQTQQNQVPPTYHPWNSIGKGSYSSVNSSNSTTLPGGSN